MTTAAQLKQEAQAAIDRYEKEHARLYTSDGFTVFPEAEHKARVDHLRGEKVRALKGVRERAERLQAELLKDAEVSTRFAPDRALGAGERSEVRERLPVIQADVDALPTTALAEQLEGVLRNGSKAERFAYLQAAAKRRREDEKRAAEGRRPGEYRGPKTSPLDTVLGRLEESVLGEEAGRRESAASDRVAAVGDVLGLCTLGIHDVKGVLGLVTKRYLRPKNPAAYNYNPSLPGTRQTIARDRVT